MNSPVQKIDYKGCTIEIYHDEHPPESPRDWDNYANMFCFHKRYRLGDHHKNPYHPDDFSSWSEMKEQILRDYDVIHIQPLYLYDHSGITISTKPFQSRWDSMQVGWVFVPRKNVELLQGWKRITKQRKEDLRKYMNNEVEVYDDYIRGEVYGYRAVTPEGEDIDSCWGFYGYDKWDENGLFDYAKPAIDYYIKKQRKLHFDKVKTMIRNNVPLIKRQSIIHKPDILSYAN